MIKMTEYAKRRKALMQQIGENGIIILSSAPEILRNGDSHYQYRQNSDFYYLTGFNEPEAILVLAPKRKEGEYILFNREKDALREMWEGERAGQKGACKDYLADQSFPSSEFSKILPELLMGREAIHCSLGMQTEFDNHIITALNKLRVTIRSGTQWPRSIVDIGPSLHEMRLFKSSAEIALMQKAADITTKAFLRAMKACKPGMYENQLEAELLYEFLRGGAHSPAYGSIVGAGKNSCTIHYVSNDQQIHSGDLVLIDAGAEYQNYAADVTRTFPANGRFSAEQRAIYELVLIAQKAAIKSVKPGSAWTTAQDIIVKVLTQGLLDLGILKGKVDSLIEKKAYAPYYVHRSGHWLGLDVHDAGSYRISDKWRKLQPGMALTIEPGLYMSDKIPGLHKRWHHIGVRIEDDVLVTEKGCDVLTREIPKEIADIEALMAK